MQHVASKPSVHHSQPHGVEPRNRPAAPDPKQPTSPFSLLLDSTDEPPPARPKDQDNTPKPADRAAPADHARGTDQSQSPDQPQPAAKAKETSEATSAQGPTKTSADPQGNPVVPGGDDETKANDETTKTAAETAAAAQPAAAVVVPTPQASTDTATPSTEPEGSSELAKAAGVGGLTAGQAAPKGKTDQDTAADTAGDDDSPSTNATAPTDAGATGKPVEAPKAQTHAPAAPADQDKGDHTRVHQAAGSGETHGKDDATNLQAAGNPGDGAAAAKSSDGAPIVTAQHQADRTATAAAPTAPAANTSPAAVPLAGVAVEIAARAQGGHNRFEIRLDPPELGKIHVHLDVDKSGQVTSRLVVDRADTLDALRRDAAGLERALQDAGLKTADNGLQFTLRDQSFAGRDDNAPSGNAAHLVVPDSELAPIEASAGYGRLLRTAGGVDIRV